MTHVVTQEEWDLRFLGIAQREYATWSKDPDEQVGAVVVSPDRRQSTPGYNGFPTGIQDMQHKLRSNQLKNDLTVHAELNAILNARTDLSGWTLYCTKAPCLDCAKAIIQVGIARVVCPTVETGSSWAHSQGRAYSLMLEAGVEACYIDWKPLWT